MLSRTIVLSMERPGRSPGSDHCVSRSAAGIRIGLLYRWIGAGEGVRRHSAAKGSGRARNDQGGQGGGGTSPPPEFFRMGGTPPPPGPVRPVFISFEQPFLREHLTENIFTDLCTGATSFIPLRGGRGPPCPFFPKGGDPAAPGGGGEGVPPLSDTCDDPGSRR